MADVASIAWLGKEGIGVVNRIGSLSVWSSGIIFILYWGKGELEHLGGAAQAGFKLLSIIIDQYQQSEQSERFI